MELPPRTNSPCQRLRLLAIAQARNSLPLESFFVSCVWLRTPVDHFAALVGFVLGLWAVHQMDEKVGDLPSWITMLAGGSMRLIHVVRESWPAVGIL
jgi:uncharacterized membrane protein